MLNYCDELKALFMNSSTAVKKTRIYVTGENYWIPEENLVAETLSIREQLSSDANLAFGSCEASELDVETIDFDANLQGKEIEVYMFIGTEDGFGVGEPQTDTTVVSSYYRICMGKFVVQSHDRKSNRRFRSLVAYDHMIDFDVDVADWYNGLTFPITLRNMRASLMRHIGITEDASVPYLLNDGLLLQNNLAEGAELFGRELIVWMEQANGVFGHIDRNGVFRHMYLRPNEGLYPFRQVFPGTHIHPSQIYEGITDGAIALDPGDYYGMEWDDYVVKSINHIAFSDEEGNEVFDFGTGTNGYRLENNMILFDKTAGQYEEIAVNVYSMITERTYTPFRNHKGIGYPWVEVGDAVSITTNEGTFESYILVRTLSGMQALFDEYEAQGEEYREFDNSIARTMNIFLNKTKASFKVMDGKIEAEVVRATREEGTMLSRITQTESSIQSVVERSFGDGSDSLKSMIEQESGKIETTITDGKTRSNFSQTLGEFRFTSNLFSWSATNSSMTSDGTLTCKNANITGKVTANTGKIGGFTINGSKLTAGDDAEIEFGQEYTLDESGFYCFGINITESGIAPGSVGNKFAHIWENDTGTIYVNDLYIDQDWWDGWSVTDTVQELWEYVYHGGWDRCPDDDDDDCDDYDPDCRTYDSCDYDEIKG